MKSREATPPTAEAFQRELGELLHSLQFRAVDGGFAVGRLASVQIVPMGQPREPAYRLQAIVGSLNPAVPWLEGWLLSLSFAHAGKTAYAAAITNHRGEADFPALIPAQAECSLELRTLGFDATLDALRPFLEEECGPSEVREREADLPAAVHPLEPVGLPGETARLPASMTSAAGRRSRVEVPPELQASFVVNLRELTSSGGVPFLRASISATRGRVVPRWTLVQGDTFIYPTRQSAAGGEHSFDLPLGDYALYVEQHSVLRARGGAVRTRGAARPASGARRSAPIKGTRRSYQPIDLKITAALEAESSKRSRLVITARDASLANTTVVCSFGSAARTLVRLNCREKDLWEGSVVLDSPFATLARCIPHFEIQHQPAPRPRQKAAGQDHLA